MHPLRSVGRLTDGHASVTVRRMALQSVSLTMCRWSTPRLLYGCNPNILRLSGVTPEPISPTCSYGTILSTTITAITTITDQYSRQLPSGNSAAAAEGTEGRGMSPPYGRSRGIKVEGFRTPLFSSFTFSNRTCLLLYKSSCEHKPWQLTR